MNLSSQLSLTSSLVHTIERSTRHVSTAVRMFSERVLWPAEMMIPVGRFVAIRGTFVHVKPQTTETVIWLTVT